MKWLQGNPLGTVLVAIGGFLALLALGMAVVWNLPVSADADDTVTNNATAEVIPLVAGEAGSLDDYRIVDIALSSRIDFCGNNLCSRSV